MNFLDYYKIIEQLPDEDIRNASVMMKAAWCHFEQQRLFHVFNAKCPDLTSVMIVNYSTLSDCEVVATFSDGARVSEKFTPGLFSGDAESTLSHIIAIRGTK